jgi:hypothetical protein
MRVVRATTDVHVGVGTSTGVISFASAVGTGISAWVVVVTRAVDVCFSRSPIVHDYGLAG